MSSWEGVAMGEETAGFRVPPSGALQVMLWFKRSKNKNEEIYLKISGDPSRFFVLQPV